MRLKNKISIITGAGSGFGKGIACRFSDEGAKVVIADINREAAEIVAAEIGENALAVTCDVSQDGDVSAMFERTLKHWGRLDILVNNAGTTHRNKPMTDFCCQC